MSLSIRAGTLLALMVFTSASIATAAEQKQIDAAIKKGADYLKSRYAKGNPGSALPGSGGADHGIGPTCLAGLALLESGVPITDPALKTITEMVRNASYSQHKTYQVSLCLIYLDRLGDTNDVPLIQMLAARLVVGQNSNGGWGYDTVPAVPPADEQRLRAIRPNQQAGKLHPEIEKYGNQLAAAKGQAPTGIIGGDDNSNTQFGVLATWIARKHAVPVEAALDLIEKRFLASQSARTGGWSYSGGPAPDVGVGSPSMYCAGLIGLATGVARREERRAKADQPKKDDKSKGDTKTKSDDPFFNPPAKAGGIEPKKGGPARAPDARDRAVQFAFAGLGAILAESAKAGRGGFYIGGTSLGHHDLYFFWSLERAGVIFGIEKIGGVDWYELGANTLVHTQGQNGAWQLRDTYGPDVSTSFAVLFLCRSNLARDLSSKVQKEVSTEMRAGAGPTGTAAKSNEPGATANPSPAVPDPILSGPTGSEAAVLAGELLRANEKDWEKALKKLRDTKGTVYTQALVASVSRLDGDRLKSAREALAERLTRMTAATLRTMAKDEDPELRRAAVLAMAMKDDKTHLPDLVAALLDDEEVVIRAAKAGLKSVTGQDFGPAINATAGEKKLAVASWNDWLSKQKK